MPFTFSHPAAAVPLGRWLRLPVSALFVGSLSPDFIYFLRLQASGEVGHTLPGLFTFCLPTSLLVLWLWHRVVKQPAAALLPHWMHRRVAPLAAEHFAFGPGRRLAVVVAGILLGALTHDAWDAFTHADGWVAERVPLLQLSMPFPGFGSMPVYKLGQFLGTAAGAALLAWWAWRWLRTQPEPTFRVATLPKRRTWLLGLLVAAAVAAVSYARWHADPLTDYLAFRLFVLKLIVTACSALWVGLLGFAGWYHTRKQKAGAARQAGFEKVGR